MVDFTYSNKHDITLHGSYHGYNKIYNSCPLISTVFMV